MASGNDRKGVTIRDGQTLKNSSSTTLARVRAKILSLHKSGISWRDMSSKTYKGKVKPGTLCRIAKDENYYPRRADVLSALGLPAIGPGRICPVHGKVCDHIHRAPNPERSRRPSIKRVAFHNTVYEENTLTW
jgi:hypothetical protein